MTVARSRAVPAVSVAAVALLVCAAPAASQAPEPRLGVFALGQQRHEVSQAAGTALGPGRCAITRAEDTDYRFHFTPGGRLYRIETRRDLGTGEFSDALRADFLRRITAEHGAPDVSDSHSGYVRAIWGRPGEARRVIKLTPAKPGGGLTSVIMRENLLDPALLRQDEHILTTGSTPTVGEQIVADAAAAPSRCPGRLRPTEEAAANR